MKSRDRTADAEGTACRIGWHSIPGREARRQGASSNGSAHADRGSGRSVPGAASGLGLATARRLAAGGALVTIVDLPASRGEAVAAELGGVFVPADVTSVCEVRAAVAEASALAPIRIVVSCAGIATVGKVLDRGGEPTPLEDFERAVRVNLTARPSAPIVPSCCLRSEPRFTSTIQSRRLPRAGQVAVFRGRVAEALAD